jgi:hypothetical protein
MDVSQFADIQEAHDAVQEALAWANTVLTYLDEARSPYLGNDKRLWVEGTKALESLLVSLQRTGLIPPNLLAELSDVHDRRIVVDGRPYRGYHDAGISVAEEVFRLTWGSADPEGFASNQHVFNATAVAEGWGQAAERHEEREAERKKPRRRIRSTLFVMISKEATRASRLRPAPVAAAKGKSGPTPRSKKVKAIIRCFERGMTEPQAIADWVNSNVDCDDQCSVGQVSKTKSDYPKMCRPNPKKSKRKAQ